MNTQPQGGLGLLMGSALIFVAYEGFELIPNAVHETRDPERDLPRGILLSIAITIAIYVLVSLVAVGNLLPEEIGKYKEYALAEAAKPFLGHAGFLLIGLGALLSTASAINATLFGTARLGKVMAEEQALPRVFSMRERTRDMIFASINLSALRLRERIGSGRVAPAAGFALCLASWMVLCGYLWLHARESLLWIGVFYLGTTVLELLFSERRLLFPPKVN